jgi:methanogenic corrinoid protein MtbC1
MSEYGNDISRSLDANRVRIAEAVTDRHFAGRPELLERYGAAGREKCLQDAQFHLSYLAEAIAADLPSLFSDYVAWACAMLAGRGIDPADLASNLHVIREVIDEVLPGDAGATAAVYIDEGLARLPEVAAEPARHIVADDPLADLAERYLAALLDGDRRAASAMILDAVDSGVTIKDVYLRVFQPSQREIGRLWQVNKITVAQEHFCTAATQLVMSLLYPRLFARESNGRSLVATCVAGDLHEIGLRMVADFFEMEGWDTYYVGASAPIPSVVAAIVERRADVLAVSATITSHVRDVAALVAAVRANPQTSGVKIIVGGYPFNLGSELWRMIGADGSASDAAEAIALADRLTREETA